MPAPASAVNKSLMNAWRTVSPKSWSVMRGIVMMSWRISRRVTLPISASRYSGGGVKYWSSM